MASDRYNALRAALTFPEDDRVIESLPALLSGRPAGRLTQEEMIRVFNQSRINLNLSNASIHSNGIMAAARDLMYGTASRVLKGVPGGSFARRVQWQSRSGDPVPGDQPTQRLSV